MSTDTGPDVVIAGAARSGTSSLAAQLGAHANIDPGKVKESNYFSREFHRGDKWYDSLYAQRRDGLLRLDASTSYTSTLYPESLGRLADASPDAFVIYVMRQPTQRAISHYLYRHYYFKIELAPDFGTALRTTSFYVAGSEYSRWLPALGDLFPERQLLLVPFELVTDEPGSVVAEVCRQLGIARPQDARHQGRSHRNNVVEYRNASVRRASQLVRRSALYPALRGAVGAGRLRSARALLTREARLPTAAEALASCDDEQTESLRRLDERAGSVALQYLVAQDDRLGLSWAGISFASRDRFV